MRKFYFLTIVVCLCACTENSKKEDNTGQPNYSGDQKYVKPQLKNEGYRSFESVEEEENLANLAMLKMAIDSTYSAMSQIESIKEDINELNATGFSSQERNYRSKSLRQLNLIQNTLCRQMDSALLVNLKTHTSQLVLINKKIESNSTHLQKLSDNLQKAAVILDRISGILSTCVSRGLVKPASPPPAT